MQKLAAENSGRRFLTAQLENSKPIANFGAIKLLIMFCILFCTSAQATKRSLYGYSNCISCIDTEATKYCVRTKFATFGNCCNNDSSNSMCQSGDSYRCSNDEDFLEGNSKYFLCQDVSLTCGLQEVTLTSGYTSHEVEMDSDEVTNKCYYKFILDSSALKGAKIIITKLEGVQLEIYGEKDSESYKLISRENEQTELQIEAGSYESVVIFPTYDEVDYDMYVYHQAHVTVEGIESPKSSSLSGLAIFLICCGTCCLISCAVYCIGQVVYYKRIQNKKPRAQVFNLQTYIQNQSNDPDEQSVSFDQMERIQNYIILEAEKHKSLKSSVMNMNNNGASINLNMEKGVSSYLTTKHTQSIKKKESDMKLLKDLGISMS